MYAVGEMSYTDTGCKSVLMMCQCIADDECIALSMVMSRTMSIVSVTAYQNYTNVILTFPPLSAAALPMF